MKPATDRIQHALATTSRVALVMPVSLFEVPSMYDLPRRARHKLETCDDKHALRIERSTEAYRRGA
ncbi:MAG: hypothetical protein ACTHK7_17345 [Aureliella sp.]